MVASSPSPFFAVSTYWLSRVAFVATHLVFVAWLMFVLNDPFNLGFNTLDSSARVVPCTSFDQAALIRNVLVFFFVWWAPHSILARRVVKQAIGTWGSVYDRPLFAFIAPFTWLATILLWTPIDTCAVPAHVLDLPVWRLALHGGIFALASVVVLGLFYLLPSHVFGTDRCTWVNGRVPAAQKHGIITAFPYGVVRHPAAAAFLWFYWAVVPSHTANHYLLASLWSLFIVVGTLLFEEGGLRGADEFGDKYRAYARHVNAFYPSLWSLKKLVGLRVPSIDAKHQ